MYGRHPNSHRQYGLTMIEMVVTIVLIGIVSAVGALMMAHAFESYELTRNTSFADAQGRLALERMAREMRAIRSTTDLTMSTTSTNPIFFTDVTGSNVCYCYESVTGTVRRGTSIAPNCGTGGVAPTLACGVTSTQPLADNIVANGLNYYYYTNTGAAATTAAQVYDISISLQVTKGIVNQTYRMTVQPREF